MDIKKTSMTYGVMKTRYTNVIRISADVVAAGENHTKLIKQLLKKKKVEGLKGKTFNNTLLLLEATGGENVFVYN